jgi:choline-sulfatase
MNGATREMTAPVPYGDEIMEPVRKAGPDRPNILMIFSDEHHWAYSGFNGHPIVRTPNLDRLAARGVNFTNAYCNSPLCSPSRQSFMAGQHPHKAGLWNNCTSMPENSVTWAHALHQAGYETLLCGKMHFNGYQRMYGFDRRPVLEMNTDGQLIHSYGVRTSHDWTRPLPYVSGNGSPLAKVGPDTPERFVLFRHDRTIVDGAVRILREKAEQPGSRPWAMCCAAVLPHPPFRGRPDLFESYEGMADLPFNLAGENLGDVDRALRVFNRMDRTDYTEADVLRMRQAYFALITEFDEYVGRILDTLDDCGLTRNTVVMYFSDHGEMAGEHGMIYKCSLREASAKIPLIVSRPGRWPEGRSVGVPVSMVDLYPTFLDIAGYRLPGVLASDLDGHSLVPLIEGRESEFGGNGVFCEFEGEGWNHPRCFIREGNLKYVFNHTARHEMYDLSKDPQEMNNLIADTRHAAVGNRLRERILSFWNPDVIEKQVLRTQARQKIAYCRNVCRDMGW